VRRAEELGLTLEELGMEEYQAISAAIQPDVYPALDPAAAVAARTSPGGTAPENVTKALKEARKRLWPDE
jgi:argininosuccinate lyase